MSQKITRRSNRINAATDPSFCPHPSTNQLIYAFLLHCRNRNLSERSIGFYEFCLEYVQKVFANQKQALDFLTVTHSDFQQHFVRYMVDQKLAPNTINGRIKTCKAFFTFLVQERYREENIAKGIVLLKCPKNQIQTFSNTEMLQLSTAGSIHIYRASRLYDDDHSLGYRDPDCRIACIDAERREYKRE